VPRELAGRAKEVFLDTVSACKPTHFEPQDTPILVEFCRATALADEAAAALATEGAVIDGKASPWVGIQATAQKTMTTLATKLRLAPTARASNPPSRPGGKPTPPLSYYERQALQEGDHDGSA
jgi:phage terminase small subunit